MPEHNEISQKNQTFSGIKMPAIINFYEFTGIKKFNGNDYNKLQEEEDKKYEEKLKKYNYYKKMETKYAIPETWQFIILGVFLFQILNFISHFFFKWTGTHPIIIGLISIAILFLLKIFFKNRFEQFEDKQKMNYPNQVDIIKEKNMNT